MGECHAPFPYVEEQLVSIEGALSSERLARYVRAAKGDRKEALRLYLYNARLAKACLFPLGMAEIVVRNAIDRCLSATFGPQWFRFDPTVTGIPTSSSTTLKSVVERLGADDHGAYPIDRRSEIVTSLPFEFWCALLRSSTEHLWETCLRSGFPNLKVDQGRRNVSALASKLSRFRNRVVHHEPIFEGWNLQSIQTEAVELIRMVCEDTAFWVRRHSTIMHAVRTKPERPDAFEPLSARATSEFVFVEGSNTLESAVKMVGANTRVIVVGKNRAPVRCLRVTDVMKLLMRIAQSGSTDGLSRAFLDASEGLPALRFLVWPECAPYISAQDAAREHGAEVIFCSRNHLVIGAVILSP